MIYETTVEMQGTLGEGVRASRLAANLSLQETAARSGVSMTALRNLEAGRNASTATLLAVCRTLRRTDWIQGIAPAELGDALFDRPKSGRRLRASPRRKAGVARAKAGGAA